MYTEYLGVYENNYFKTKDEFPYRVALKRYVNSEPEYINVGIYRTKKTAAYVYNIYALSTFGKGAVINDVQPTAEIEAEIMELEEDMDSLNEHIQEAAYILEEHGKDIKIHNKLGQ